MLALRSNYAARFEPETVLVSAGEFWMGTSEREIPWLVRHADWVRENLDDDWFSDELPQHKVYLNAYRISRFPVTNLQFQAFAHATGHRPPPHWDGDAAPEELTDHPVVDVSWDDAQTYCAWLSAQTGEHYRLPTEAEWEKAARGDDRRIYPWGNEFDPALCNTAEGRVGRTTPVGRYSPVDGDSPYGCADMTGNVWEWCHDWYAAGYHREALREYPTGPGEGEWRVVRGGSWEFDLWFARCAFRFYLDPNYRGNDNGFRVVVALPISEPR